MSSDAKLKTWIKHLLFGGGFVSAPLQVQHFAKDMISKGIDIKHTMENGGLTMKSYYVAGDLEKLVDYFDKEPDDYPVFETRPIASVFNQLLIILKRPKQVDAWQLPCRTDSDILKSILENKAETENLPYKDAEFWGKLAYNVLNHRRPPSDLAPLHHPSATYLKNVVRLYDVTCKSLGKIANPFDMVLVPRRDYVHPVFFKDLKAFLRLYPNHALSASIRNSVDESMELFLDARLPTFCGNENARAFMNNVSVVHEAVRKVDDENVPPKVIDVFQRLLALSGQDHLWQTQPLQKSERNERSPMDLFHLYEKIYYLEKQNHLLLNSLTHLTM